MGFKDFPSAFLYQAKCVLTFQERVKKLNTQKCAKPTERRATLTDKANLCRLYLYSVGVCQGVFEYSDFGGGKGENEKECGDSQKDNYRKG